MGLSPVDPRALELCKQVQEPLVSVGMLVYNQRQYIISALESILRQEVSFSYEIVIADDGSTDGSREILEDYARRYPKLIRLILQEENVGLLENSKCLKRACRGRYRATQEGDDFWIDPERLQRQVEFLENNPEYVAVCGDLLAADANGVFCKFPWGGKADSYKLGDSDYELKDFENWKIPCHVGAWLSYNLFAMIDQERFDAYESYSLPGDRKTPLYTMLYGKIKVSAEPVMVRRFLWQSKTSHIGSFNKTSAPVRVYNWAKEAQRMDKEFLHLGLDMQPTLDRMFLSTFREFMLQPSKARFLACCRLFWCSGHIFRYFFLFQKRVFIKFCRKVKREGFLGCCFGMLKFCARAVKKVFTT